MFKKFTYLHDDARSIRDTVFVDEQKFVVEFDDIDDVSNHIVCYQGGNPIATLRYFKGDEPYEYIIGRVAVLKQYRGKNIGRDIMTQAEENIIKDGGKKISLSAQAHAQKFYERLGYIAFGEPYIDEDCYHVHMEKML